MLVTGGSRGIGGATARVLAERGHAVCINYVEARAAALSLVEELNARGAHAIALQADVSDERQVIAMFDECVARLGPLHGLVNAAGILDVQAPLVDMPTRRIERILAVNVLGTILCAREAVRRMSTALSGQGGAIVNVSSAASRLGAPGEYVDYAASKGAIDAFTVGLSKEVALDGIRVNAVRPGFIETDIHLRSGDPDRLSRVQGTIPMRRPGRPIEVAEAIAWLLSRQSSYTTGAIVDVAGGR